MFEWDPEKSEQNLISRGFDFGYATRIFQGDLLERQDDRRNYGERRMIATGEVDGDLLTVVYTWRAARRRIISARRAHRRERDDYRREIGGRDREGAGRS
jgi:uncharacterized DUF497 family protein